jgi:hypothetical protein
MTTHHQAFASDALAAGEPAAPLSNRIRSMGLRLVARVDTCADYYAAAAIYEQLSALSDCELARRGLSRATLARDVCAACDRGFGTLRDPLLNDAGR